MVQGVEFGTATSKLCVTVYYFGRTGGIDGLSLVRQQPIGAFPKVGQDCGLESKCLRLRGGVRDVEDRIGHALKLQI